MRRMLPSKAVGIIAGIVGLTITPATMTAGDWPEFRGPTAMGQSSARNLPITWSPTNNVAWKQPIAGSGWSSPVLRSGRLYLTTAIQKASGGLTFQALALDATTGKPLWETTVFDTAGGGASIHSKNGQASPTPIVTENRLFVHFGHHGTAALDLAGKVVWRQESVRYTPVHGNGGSPVLVDGLLIYGVDGASEPRLVALDAKDGKVRWETPRETPAKRKFSFCTPLVIESDGKPLVVSPASGAALAYDPTDGREVWRVLYGEGYSVVPRPVLARGLIFVASGYDRPILHAIRPGGKGDVTASHVAWTLAKGAPNTPSMVVVDDLLYCVSDAGIASAIPASETQ